LYTVLSHQYLGRAKKMSLIGRALPELLQKTCQRSPFGAKMWNSRSSIEDALKVIFILPVATDELCTESGFCLFSSHPVTK
jgi:hypothetical protein